MPATLEPISTKMILENPILGTDKKKRYTFSSVENDVTNSQFTAIANAINTLRVPQYSGLYKQVDELLA